MGGISAIVKTTFLDPYILYMGYHVVIALSLFYITLMIYKYPIVFTRNIVNIEIPIESIPIAEELIETFLPNSELSETEGEGEEDYAIILKIENLMRDQKPFKNPNFSLNDLAAAIAESRNAISHVLNNRLNKNFYNYINELRIEESKLLLADQKLRNFTIEGIAAESGFKTMSVFYRFFKDAEKVTPAVYRKNISQS